MSKMKSIPKGALFTVTSGEYSDYCVQGVFRALQKIDPNILRDEWIANHPEQERSYNFAEDEFLADMARRGLIEDVECWEFHLGDYGEINRMSLTKMDRE